MPATPAITDSVRAALEGARAMIENDKSPIHTDADFRAQVNILSAVLAAVFKELGPEAVIRERGLVDRLIEKGLAAGVDVGEKVEELRRLFDAGDLGLVLAADRTEFAVRRLKREGSPPKRRRRRG